MGCPADGKAPRLAVAERFDKLASPRARRHNNVMRIILTVVASLLLAACGATPTPVSTPIATVVERPERGALIGLDAPELATRFGQPRLQVREGTSIKLQFAGGSCLLDAYLYPTTGNGGGLRVTHVDTRNRDGRSVDQAGCVRMIEGR